MRSEVKYERSPPKGRIIVSSGSYVGSFEPINEAERLAERFEDRVSRAILHRLRAVFLAALGAEETQIQSSFCEAIRIAKEQKSI